MLIKPYQTVEAQQTAVFLGTTPGSSGQSLGPLGPCQEQLAESDLQITSLRKDNKCLGIHWGVGGYHLVVTNIAVENHHV